MPQDPIEKLRTFFIRYGVDGRRVEVVIEPLIPLIALVHTRPFALETEVTLGQEDMRAAIAAITDKSVQRVELVSMRGLRSQHPDLFDGKGKAAKREIVDRVGGPRYRNIVKDRLGPWTTPYDRWNSGEDAKLLMRVLESVGFNTDLKGELNRAFGRSLAGEIDNSLWTSVYYYVLFALVGNSPGFDATVSAVTLASQVVPVGELAREPGVWLVLSA